MILQGDCREVMHTLEADSVDAIVTDPPYGLEFMGKEWDTFKTGRSAKYSKGGEVDPEKIDKRSGKGGSGPSYVNRPAKRCRKCGRQAWSGSPCTCADPEWDIDNSPLLAFQAWSEEWAREALRVLKPGGHLLAFGGSRTYHRLACAIEDAGFEIRDQVQWIYGSGFPKSRDVSKAIDAEAGAEREVVGIKPGHEEFANRKTRGHIEFKDGSAGFDRPWMHDDVARERYHFQTAPATETARQWQGWGTALKPAHEPLVLARKSLVGTVAANVLEHGTGAINVDGCRVGINDDERTIINNRSGAGVSTGCWGLGNRPQGEKYKSHNSGRWPANIIHDGSDEVEAAFAAFGLAKGQQGKARVDGVNQGNSVYGKLRHVTKNPEPRLDTGTASRFFYAAKASKADREDGLEGMPEITKRILNDGIPSAVNSDPRGMSGGGDRKARNNHPTVKPTSLMRYLCRLITPPGGLVLDPFAGSGSTGRGAILEGFRFIGIEMSEEYAEIARRRIAAVREIPKDDPDQMTLWTEEASHDRTA